MAKSNEERRLLALHRLKYKVGVPLEQVEVKAGEINTTYYVAGKGRPLVLIHGAGGGAVNWFPIVKALSKKFKIIIPDVVGYGESDKPSATYDKIFFSR